MEWLTMDQELAAARKEIQGLKWQLQTKESAVHNLEMDMNFHVLKAQELQGILDTKDDDEFRQQLEIKALQNTGLTVQVKELRYQLGNSANKTSELKSELQISENKLEHLAKERKSHQRMLMEMSDVVRTLGQIDIDYTKKTDKASNWMAPGNTLDKIKRKIGAVEEDRQRRIQENQELQTVLFEKGIEVESLQKNAYHLEAIVKDREQGVFRDDEGFRLACQTKDRQIMFLKHALERAGEHKPIEYPVPTNVSYHRNSYSEHYVQEPAMEVQLQDDGSTVILSSTASISRITEDPAHQGLSRKNKNVGNEEASFSSLESPEAVPEESEQRLEQVDMGVYKALEEQVSQLQGQLEGTRTKVKASRKKQELRENLLRDVIFQYKELQKENDDTTARLLQMQNLVQGRRESSGSQTQENCNKTKRRLKTQNDATGPEIIEESPTVDTEATSANASKRADVLDSEKGNESTELTGVQIEYSDAVVSEEEYRRLEKECARLEHEYEDAVTRIANLEEDLSVAKEEAASANSLAQSKQSGENATQHKYESLQVDHQGAVDKTSQLQEDLEFAQMQAIEARQKQRQREKDLWEVIDQYKKLSEENKDARVKIQGVESQLGKTQAIMKTAQHELSIFKSKGNRRTLIYEYRKMEQDLEECQLKVVTLERDLNVAKAAAARSKEETKCTRKRLAGCHFHFKQLQSQYNEVVAQMSEKERDLSRAKRQLKIYSAQEDSWTEKLIHIRGKREETGGENRRLEEENKELKDYCNDLLTLASKSIEAL